MEKEHANNDALSGRHEWQHLLGRKELGLLYAHAYI